MLSQTCSEVIEIKDERINLGIEKMKFRHLSPQLPASETTFYKPHLAKYTSFEFECTKSSGF